MSSLIYKVGSRIFGSVLATAWMVFAIITPSEAVKADALHLDRIRLPAGFNISIFSRNVPNARQIALSPSGTVFVGSRERARRVHALVDKDRDWRAEAVHIVARDLDLPSGVAFRGGALFVAANFQLLKIAHIEGRLSNPPKPIPLFKDLPRKRYHGWRYIKFGPDGNLYMPIGIPCDACVRGAPFGHLLMMDAEGRNRRIYAKGIRSVQGLDWHPRTGELWFSDNGRNRMGDDLPPDEINRITKPGQHFGSPFCHAGSIPDPQLANEAGCEGYDAPAIKLPAHVSPLGITFYDRRQFPEKYRKRLLIAEHGSWDRSEPVGYRITTVAFDQHGKQVGYEVFAEGWLGIDGNYWGRPTDLVVAADGSLLISDDHAGVIYRISHTQ